MELFVILILGASTGVLGFMVLRLRRNNVKLVMITGPSEPMVQEMLNLSKKVQGIKKKALVHSADYCAALGVQKTDLDTLSDEKRVFVITIDGGEVTLIIKNTCGSWAPHDAWRTIIQARAKRTDMETCGGGTARIEVLSDKDHAAVIEAIGANKCEIEIASIWP